MLSFIVPAYNEQLLIGRTLGALHAAAGALREPYEVIVADDASTDETAAIARAHGAQVVSVNHRQIAATRNAGARRARGELLFFGKRPVPERAQQASHSLGGLGGSGNEDGLTVCFLVWPKLGRVTPLG